MNNKSTSIVIFGITGNLAKLKILPAIYDLFKKGTINSDTHIIGIGRKTFRPEQFAIYILSIVSEYAQKEKIPLDPKALNIMLSNLSYLEGDTMKESVYKNLARKMAELKSDIKIFYLATFPSLYKTIFSFLKNSNLTTEESGWTRVLIEKPLGNDLSSAKFLNKMLSEFFKESQIFRLDHYLGKETLQNILTFRFGNRIFEPLFNREHIDHIQISVMEDFGIGKRGQYYDSAGALRDIGQNHILQMLALVTMNTPTSMTNEGITRVRIKVFENLKPEIDFFVQGQYQGYRDEENVNPVSTTDTFFAFKAILNLPNFKNVPVYLRSGKKMKSTATEIAIVFKQNENINLKLQDLIQNPNSIIFRIQPNEGIILRFSSKKPGSNRNMQPSTMEFCYKQLTDHLPNPYETLIEDAFLGDQTFFNDAFEVEAQWKFIDQLVNLNFQPIEYKQGSWGPDAATELIEKDNRHWIEPATSFCRV